MREGEEGLKAVVPSPPPGQRSYVVAKQRKEDAGATGKMSRPSGGSSPPGSGSDSRGSADGVDCRKVLDSGAPTAAILTLHEYSVGSEGSR